LFKAASHTDRFYHSTCPQWRTASSKYEFSAIFGQARVSLMENPRMRCRAGTMEKSTVVVAGRVFEKHGRIID
jgi:hypothetical protein